MKTWRFKKLLQNDGWLDDVYLTVDAQGRITNLTQELPIESGGIEEVNGYAIPGFQNAHSHAFQYAMAGLAEIHADPMSRDDFWSWRNTMYQIALSIGPEQLESVAAMLYMEMLRHGYTSVAEFHYLHHDVDGSPFSNLSEMSERLISAAKSVGIGITLVPIFYQKGGFGVPAKNDQRRFISNSGEAYYQLLDSCLKSTALYDNSRLGIGIHSLRAVSKENILEVYSNHRDLPIHIHISEQLKEVEDCLDFYGSRPVEWLLNTVEADVNTHLVHATHLSESEIELIANSGAHVVICPSTEGNLGDGLFPLKKFQELNGHWSIGTDSHIGLNPLEEIRWLDYGQRLTTHRRNNFVSESTGNTGIYAFDQALISGRKAMGNQTEEYFALGQPLDAVIIDASQVLIGSSKPENILSTLLFSGDVTFFSGIISNGQQVVRNQRHDKKEEIEENFIKSLHQLGIR